MSNTSKPKPKPKSPGWAAFQLNQDALHRRAVTEDPYPPFRTTVTPSLNLTTNHSFSSRPFSSVILPPANFPPLKVNANSNKSTELADSVGEGIGSHAVAVNNLKGLHPWADETLIEDVLLTSGNDIDKASTFLKGMVCTSESQAGEVQRSDSVIHITSQCDESGVLFGTSTALATDIANLASTLEDALRNSDKEFRYKDTSCEKCLSDDAASNMKLILSHLRSIPVEPEWEENDVYLRHRKDALKMTRSASQHSRAASNAFLRGDHLSAQKHSLRAREEWSAAEKLNDRAAKEILSIRNSEDDPWKLDLHGLHAAEAVRLLKEHLLKIETQFVLKRPTSPPRVKTENGIVGSSSRDSVSKNVQNLDKQQATFRQRPTSLQVITGIGNHSRGQAALPTAVRSYLDENGYRFDDTRPGLITVRPKFRQ